MVSVPVKFHSGRGLFDVSNLEVRSSVHRRHIVAEHFLQKVGMMTRAPNRASFLSTVNSRNETLVVAVRSSLHCTRQTFIFPGHTSSKKTKFA